MAARAGRALRQKWELERLAKIPCPQCGHTSPHRELPYETYEISEEPPYVTVTPNPDYKPLHFHCSEPGCECVKVETPR